MTKVLMISSDEKVLQDGSPAQARMKEYGALFDELYIIVRALKNEKLPTGKVAIAPNTFAYPTASEGALSYAGDIVRIGNAIIADTRLSPKDSVITTQDPFVTGTAALKLSRETDLPLHVQIHTDMHSLYFKKGFLNRLRIVMSGRVLRAAKAIRTVSERTRSGLSESLRAKASVLPVFVDLDEIRNAPIAADLRKKYPQWDKIAFMASRITTEKDMPTAIRAFAETLKVYPKAGLVIGGAGSELGSLKALVSKLGVGQSVGFEPWADHDTLVSYMKTCDAFMLSSLYEGYGMTLLEAHAAGATIVSTDVGMAPLLAGDTCRPGDVRAFADLISKAFSGILRNRAYIYPYPSRAAYLEEYKKDIERALL
ncbi:MAG TPA: glycosyltransferase [Candidatus Paceibacterota bacterium]|jgi:glycosyltransferase involved in cell wall biosynthesis|nr:glycosyltransferase [Candidatus Paceibacterota bacterium]